MRVNIERIWEVYIGLALHDTINCIEIYKYWMYTGLPYVWTHFYVQSFRIFTI